jgi:hypothetical protein
MEYTALMFSLSPSSKPAFPPATTPIEPSPEDLNSESSQLLTVVNTALHFNTHNRSQANNPIDPNKQATLKQLTDLHKADEKALQRAGFHPDVITTIQSWQRVENGVEYLWAMHEEDGNTEGVSLTDVSIALINKEQEESPVPGPIDTSTVAKN